MAHHHHYFTTPSPYNRTIDDDNTSNMTIYGIIFIVFAILIVYNYIKYVQSRPPNNIIYQDANEENDGFPDINDFFPAYLENNADNSRRAPPPAMIAAPPPYNNEETRSLQELEPPSYESILNSLDNSERNNNTVNQNQSEV